MRIAIADDSALLREGVAGLLTRRGHEVVAQVGSADQVQGVVDTHAPDLVITDVRMPPNMRDDGLQAALALRKQGPVNVLVLSQYVEQLYARELLASGANIGAFNVGNALGAWLGGVVIAAADLTERFARSSGPGGQGVNTTDSRVELVLDLARSPSLPDHLRERVLERLEADRLIGPAT